jgi:hypothetical protein
MPNSNDKKPRPQSNLLLWGSIAGAAALLLLCCCGVGGVGTYFAVNRGGGVPGFTVAKVDADNVENTRAWAEKTVARLKEIDAKGNKAATDAEVAKAEKELKDALLNKKVRWSLAINGIQDDREVVLEQFFGKDIGKVKTDFEAEKPRRKLYMRVYVEEDADGVFLDTDIPRSEARKKNRYTLIRKVIEVNIRQHDENWISPDRWNNCVDILDTFCVDIILKRE